MDKFVINGPTRLTGEVTISGAKNAAVAIIPAVILSDGICRIENIPNISDVHIITQILYALGADIKRVNLNTLEIDPRNIHTTVVPHELAKRMRASYYLIGALLGKFNKARVSMPGGCDLGIRPMDLHIKGFEALGATVKTENAMINCTADNLIGSPIYLDMVSVGATVNIMLAAVKAYGLTVIENAAKEPHIVDLANFLNSMGADIRGAGTDLIKIYGVPKLHGTNYSIIPDQIEAGTYMVAAAATNGDVLVKNVIPKHLESISAKLEEMGVQVEEYDDSIRVISNGNLRRCNIKTMPHPGFPTDMQPQLSVLLSMAEGTSIVTENVWGNRFRYIDELRRMGMKAVVDGQVAVFEGGCKLTGAPVMATDLRAGAARVIAAMAAQGQSEIENIYHIERGYENIVEKLTALGADIKRVTVPDETPKATARVS